MGRSQPPSPTESLTTAPTPQLNGPLQPQGQVCRAMEARPGLTALSAAGGRGEGADFDLGRVAGVITVCSPDS
jgi:hypothetical protein